MSIRIECPSCEASYTVDDDKRGKKIRCRKCEEPISVPAGKAKQRADESVQSGSKLKMKPASRGKRDDDDDDDRRSSSKRKDSQKEKAGGLPMAMIGIGAAVVLFVCLVPVGGFGAWYFLRSKPVAEPEPQAVRDPRFPELKKFPIDDPFKKNPPEEKKQPEDKIPPGAQPNAGNPPADLPKEQIQRIKQATVYLRVTMPSGQVAEGSGFFAFEPGIIITNAHVLGMLGAKSSVPKNVQVVVNSGQVNERQMIGEVLGVDRSSDLAVVRVNEANLPTPLAMETKHELVELQKVVIFGFPFGAQLGKEITVRDSAVSSFRRDPITRDLAQIQVNGGMDPGNSGGPVVNTLGNLVGVSVAGIRGTTINFAIPAEKVHLIMQGRLANSWHGEPYVPQGNQVLLPVSFTCLDPLNRVKDMKVEVWAGAPGPPRAYTLQKPQPFPTDGPRQAHEIVYRNFGGTLDLPLPALEPGQVCWVQPIITTKAGTTHWGVAQPTPVSMIAIERRPASLQVSLTKHKERTVRLKGTSSEITIEGKKRFIDAMSVDAHFLEVLHPDPKGAAVKSSMAGFKFSVNVDGQNVPLDGAADNIVKLIPPLFILDGTNKIRERSDVNLNPGKLDPKTHRIFKTAYQLLCNSTEGVTMPMPNKTVSPKEQWNTQIPMMVKPGPKPIIADLSLQCTFEGVRVRNKRDEGVISVKGRVLGRDQYAKSLEGEITGRLAFDLTGGYISQAQLTISSELEGSDYAFIDAFDIVLDRVAGNPDGIPQPKEYKPPPEQKPLVANGPVLVNWKGTLVQKDPLDPAADGTKRQGSRMKVHTVKMEAGKTYVISLNSEQFDSYLRVEDSKKKNLAEDDDGGGFPNARIVFTCRTSGTYSVIVTAYDRKMGAYHLQVQEAGPQK